MPSGGLAGTVGQKTDRKQTDRQTKLVYESGSPTKNTKLCLAQPLPAFETKFIDDCLNQF